MQIKFKRFDKSLPEPKYQSPGAAAVDLYARIDMEIPPGEVKLVPLNVALQIPADCFVLVSARSSLHKRGLMMANGIGIGDSDYCGDGDEYRAALFNFSKTSVKVTKGERLVQMIVLPREVMQLQELNKFATQNRGGFGSTGVK